MSSPKTNKAPTYKRRNFYVDRQFQSSFIFKFCSMIILSSLLICAIVLYFAQNSTTVAIENTEMIIKPTSDFIFPILFFTIMIVTIFSSVLILVMSLLISHRVAGPAYRLKKEVDLITQGDMKRNFTLRENDHLKKLADSISDMNRTLKEKIVVLQSQTEKIEKTLKDSTKEKTQELLDELKQTLDFFKL